MANANDPTWWTQLERPEASLSLDPLSWLREALSETKKKSSRPAQAAWHEMLDYMSEADRRRYVLVSLNAAEVCQSLHHDDLAPVGQILKAVLGKKSDLTEADLRRLLSLIVRSEPGELDRLPCAEAIAACERWLADNSASGELLAQIKALRAKLAGLPGKPGKSMQKMLERIERLDDDSPLALLQPDDGWADRLKQFFESAPADERTTWAELFRHAAVVTPEPPASTWEVTPQEVEQRTGINMLSAEFAAAYDAALLDRCAATAWQNETARIVERLGSARFTRGDNRLGGNGTSNIRWRASSGAG